MIWMVPAKSQFLGLFKNVLKNSSQYYEPNDEKISIPNSFDLLHINSRGLKKKFDDFVTLCISLF